MRRREALTGLGFVFPALAGFCLFFLIPFVNSIWYCFTSGIGVVEFVGLDNFKSLFQSSAFQLAAYNTGRFTLLSVCAIMIVSFLAATLLNRSLYGMRYFRMFFILPLVVPVASIIIVWQILFAQNGVVNHLLYGLGITGPDWLSSAASFWLLLALYIWKNCGYNVILFLAGISDIDPALYEAAALDGAGAWMRTTRITLPMLSPTILFATVISIINSFKVFREAYILAGAYPTESIYLLQHFMNNNFQKLNYQRLSTASLLVFIVITLLVLALFLRESKAGGER